MQGASRRPVCPRRIAYYLRKLLKATKNSRLRKIFA